jgi:Zinc dependent phospholipase C
MPGPAIHLLAALDVLRALETGPGPFPVDDSACRNAFLCGSLGPDMGYCPGGDRFLSDLAHYVRSGELARNLVRSAQTPCQRAFAWGWVSHILVDVRGHPLINHGSAEHLLGDRNLSVSYEEDPATHVLVESGLDAIWSVTDPRASALVLRTAWDAGSVSALVRGFEGAYAAPFHASLMLTSHRASLRGTPWFMLLNRIHGARWLRRKLPLRDRLFQWFALAPAQFFSGYSGQGSLLRAITHSVRPASWLVDAAGELLRQHPAEFLAHFKTGLEELPDYNLDIGVVEEPAAGYGLTKKTLLRLQELIEKPHSPQV